MPVNIPVGLQLYSVRNDCARDLPAVLKEVARMGYEGVEFAGYHGRSAEEIRSMLDDLGLKCCGTHTKMPLMLGDEFEKTVEFNKILGNRYVIVPHLEDQYKGSEDAWKRTADLFNTLAEKLQPYMMQTGYHNHMTEFAPLPGASNNQSAWDIFFSNTRPEVIMQLDTGNAMHAGVDVKPYVSRYPGRATTVHFKEYSTKGTGYKTIFGEGEINWDEMLQLCQGVGQTKWIIIEQEKEPPPEPLQVVETCLQRLRAKMA